MTQQTSLAALLATVQPSVVIRPTQWRLDDVDLDALGRIREIVSRYDALVEDADLSGFFENDWNVLRALAQGSSLCPEFARQLDHEAEAGIASGLAVKWGIDGHRFLKAVRALSFDQRLAVLERLEAEPANRAAVS